MNNSDDQGSPIGVPEAREWDPPEFQFTLQVVHMAFTR